MTWNKDNSKYAIDAATNAQLIANEIKSAGEFNLTTTYKKNNTVLHNGSTWIAIQDTQGNTLPVLPIKENVYWRLVAQRGVDGNGAVSKVNGMSPDVNGNVEVNIPNATLTKDGLMSKADKVKLAGISTGANYVEVLDSLTSTSTTSALSAKKGKEISDKIDILTDDIGTVTTQLEHYSQFKTQIEDAITEISDPENGVEAKVDIHANDYVKHPGYGVTTNIEGAYLVTLDPAPTEYKDGMGLALKLNVDTPSNGFSVNVNGLGGKHVINSKGYTVKTVYKKDAVLAVRYSSTAMSGIGAFILQGEGGEYGTAVASDVRLGKTIGTENGIVQGTLDLSNLVPTNIKKGVTIDGVSGTLDGKRFFKVSNITFTASSGFYEATITGHDFRASQAIANISGAYGLTIVGPNGTNSYWGGALASGSIFNTNSLLLLDGNYARPYISLSTNSIGSLRLILSINSPFYFYGYNTINVPEIILFE